MRIDPNAYRQTLARRLTARRGDASLYSTEESGVGYRVVQRLEIAGNTGVELPTLYLLALHYDCSLGALVDPTEDRHGHELDVWPADAPSMPETVSFVRWRLRSLRQEKGWGARRLSTETAHTMIRPSWIFRIESGEVSRLDTIRLACVMDAMDLSIVDLLPPALRAPAVECALPETV